MDKKRERKKENNSSFKNKKLFEKRDFKQKNNTKNIVNILKKMNKFIRGRKLKEF